MTIQEHNEEIRFQIGEVTLAGTLGMPEQALGIVLFAHGSGSSRHSPGGRRGGERKEKRGRQRGEGGATDWLVQNPTTEGLRIGYFGSSTGGAAALIASVERLE